MDPPVPTSVGHITAVGNLEAILDLGGLDAYNSLRSRAQDHRSIANVGIQNRRAATIVPCPPGGSLHDYVPFYFGPKSPMLYAIHRRNVPGCTASQEEIIYLVTTAQQVQAAGLQFVFTDGHAIMGLSEFYDDLARLDQLDWQVITGTWWNDVPADLDRSRRRQAEFLVYQRMPWELITGIGVKTEVTKQRVEELLRRTEWRPAVELRPTWYY